MYFKKIQLVQDARRLIASSVTAVNGNLDAASEIYLTSFVLVPSCSSGGTVSMVCSSFMRLMSAARTSTDAGFLNLDGCAVLKPLLRHRPKSKKLDKLDS